MPSPIATSTSSPLSPDGTTSQAPSGAALVTVAGTWTWGATDPTHTTDNAILLNGSQVGIAEILMANKGGKMYARAYNGWWLWTGSGWSSTTSPAPPPPPPPPPSGPTAEWTLTQASVSGATVADASGNGNAATVVNGPLTFGAMGANFNGQQYVDSTLTVTSSALTVSVWFNATSLTAVAGSRGTGNPRLVANSRTNSDYGGFQLLFASGGASGFFDVGNGTAEGRASWSQQLVAGTWYHYVGVYNGATVIAYLNGVQVASTGFAGGAIAAGTGPDINIARDPSYAGDYFVGAIWDVRIYEQALSAAQVLALYQAVTPPPSGP